MNCFELFKLIVHWAEEFYVLTVIDTISHP